ncbi:hypothetical protein LCGC14_3082760 [marine sediment metagenome]|uniref:Type II secretion system protein GspG C-terminal domain-containing protein n=1 Tax=marine sediment metagenome TaxID=412755 RepID=A0A0F8Z3I0_9ZZZZ
MRPTLSIMGLVSVGVLIGVLLIMCFLTFHCIDQRHIETAAWILCEARQQAIYRVLVKYKEENGVLPSELSVLVEEGYLEHESTCCPVDLRKSSAKLYQYSPASFGRPESIIISGDVGNHTGEKLFPNIPVVIVTMGDGRTWCMLSPKDARTLR